MKRILNLIIVLLFSLLASCGSDISDNKSALQEQQGLEQNQQYLNSAQPPPKITWSLERDNLIKRFLLMNDRSVMFYMYIFVPGFSSPIGYYQVNKVSSVNSQLTNTEQIVPFRHAGSISAEVLPSPAEDGSYGTNGDAVFGFTPDQIYIEHNMLYIASSIPLTFKEPTNRLAIVNVEDEAQLRVLIEKMTK
jgi:hypothetical protein